MTAVPIAGITLTPRQRFLRRAIQVAAETGVRQYVYIGPVAPAGSARQDRILAMIRAASPHARIVRVVHDPRVPSPPGMQCETMRATSAPPMPTLTEAIELSTDIRRPHEMLLHWGEAMGIRQKFPVVVILDQVLDEVADADQPEAITALIRGWVADRSILIVVHESCVHRPQWTPADIDRWRARGITVPYIRTGEQITTLMDGWTLMNPGIVEVSEWHSTGVELPPPLAPTGPLIRGGVAMLM